MVDIYIAKYPFPCEKEEIYPSARKEIIERCTHQDTKMQKYYAWKLLEYGVKNSLNLTMEEADFIFSENGSWQSKHLKMSISHCKNLVAVAISDTEVGLDIENTDRNFKSDLVGKILTEAELSEYIKLPSDDQQNFLLKTWTKKEAIFKKSNQKVYSPSKINTTEENTLSYTVKFEDSSYILSVATKETNISESHIYDIPSSHHFQPCILPL